MYRVSIDVGGTFTDCLVLDEGGQLRAFKSPTTPADPSAGFLNVLEKAARGHGRKPAEFLGEVELLIHGTTLATNALINESGARTGMLTTRGFRDVIEIRRGQKNVRTSMYDVFIPPYRPLVSRELRLGVPERVLDDGSVETPLDEAAVAAALERLRSEGVESVAVCFLHSYATPEHERRAAELAKAALPGAYVTASHEILPVWREYERFSTTVVSAYVGPAVRRYLLALEARLAESGFRGNLVLMLSSGLVETVANSIPRAVYLIGSGPAAAPSAALYAGALAGRRDLLSIDMGGTSLDICLLRDGQIPTTTESWVGDERVAIKMVDIESAGAGGGSIAWIDSLGLLRVGPHSAGADPGPACYGRGGLEPTVTDANLLLGYVPADYFLGGEIALDAGAAEAALARVGAPLGMDAAEAAEAVFTAVNAYMASEITEVSTRRGHDVRDFALVAGGGAGPIHAAFLADQLGIGTVLVPSVASTYSAFGMFAMDVGRDHARSHIARADRLDPEVANRLYEEMEAESAAAFAASGTRREEIVYERTAELRYQGQFHEVEVPVSGGRLGAAELAGAVEAFHARHEALYTFSMPWKGAEFLTFRVKASVPRAAFELRAATAGGEAAAALKRTRRCRFHGEVVETPVYDGGLLGAGASLEGPAVIEEMTTTVVVPPGFSCIVDRWRNYVMSSAGETGAGLAAAAAGRQA